MIAWGRPPANERVVPMRRVAAAACELEAVNLMVTGELTALKMAMGKADVGEDPTVKGWEEVQGDMRWSVGCMRSWESELRKPVGLEGLWMVSNNQMELSRDIWVFFFSCPPRVGETDGGRGGEKEGLKIFKEWTPYFPSH